MKYWLFQYNQVLGPYDREQIADVKGFNAESLVCPEGRKGTDMGDWQRAGVVNELAEALLKTGGRVATATRTVGENLLPPEPTLRDLAVLGTLQEKTSLLENSLSQLQEDLHTRDTELSRLKVDMASKDRSMHELQTKVAELEGRVITLSSLKDDLGKDEKQIQELSDQILVAREELKRDIARKEEEERKASEKLAEEDSKLTMMADKLADKERLLDDVNSRLAEQDRRLLELQSRMDRPGFSAPASPGVSRGPEPVFKPEPTFNPMPAAKPTPLGEAPLKPESSYKFEPPMGNAGGPSLSLPTGMGPSPIVPASKPAVESFMAPPPAPTPIDSSAAPELTPLSPLTPLSLTPLGEDMPAAPAPTPLGGTTPFPTPLPSQVQPMEPPQAFVSLNDPIDPVKEEVPLTELSSLTPSLEPLKTNPKLGKPAGKPFEPEEMVAGKSLKKKGPNSKILIGAVAFSLIAAGAAMMLMKGGVGKKKHSTGVPSPELTPADNQQAQTPAMPTSPTTPANTMPEPSDPALAAVDMAKSYLIPGSNVTLAQRLETAFPPDPKSALSSWMVEKVGPDKFQVNYYTNHEKLIYQFLVQPQAKLLQGINPEAMAILNGEEPNVPKKKPAAPRAARKRVASARAGRARPSRKVALPGDNPAPDVPMAPAADTQPTADSQASDEKSIDELLLPGMAKPVEPKSSGKSKGKAAAKAQAPAQAPAATDEGIPSPDQLISNPADGAQAGGQ